MLGFYLTVRFPLSAPVLSRQFIAEGKYCYTRTYDFRRTSAALARHKKYNLEVETGPFCPVLRAIPFPEVTELFCRLPLSTLF